jgi:NAD(P)-dependent dehydrogenase (short-subunit alcohol dehydrogenase family)
VCDTPGVEELRERVAVVTGGASGIGKAMATRFAAEGMRLVVVDIEERALTDAVDELRAGGAEAIGVRADVAVARDVDEVRDRAIEAFGAVHVVCNNAGVGAGGVADTPLEVWEWVLGVNLWGVIHGCHTFLPVLREQDEGHIVNTASLAGLGGVAGLGVYCTTKFAVVGLSESLFYELAAAGSNVGVSVLCPGFVQTRISSSTRNAPASIAEWTASDTAARVRDASAALTAAGIMPAEVAEAVVDAVHDRRFFVLPHIRAALGTTKGRLEWMRGTGAPDLDIGGALKP